LTVTANIVLLHATNQVIQFHVTHVIHGKRYTSS